MDNKSDAIRVTSQNSNSNKSFQGNLIDGKDPKKRFQNVIKEEMAQERLHTQQKMQKLKEEKKQIHKKYLQNEIQKKKKQLKQLQKSQINKDGQHQALYNAKIKSEKIKLNKKQQQERAKTADKISKDRYQKALKRLQHQEQQKDIKKTIAQQIRNIHSEKEAIQRQQASNYKKILLLKAKSDEQKLKNEEKKRVIDYQNCLNKHGLNTKLTATSSNPMTFVVKANQSANQAMKRANTEENRKIQQQEKRQQVKSRNRKIAIQRGEKVLENMQRQKEYQAYCLEVQKEQQKYNLKRIQAGKINQFAGVKPLTVSQITINKKNRSEQQFQEMFIRVPSTSLNNQAASKYKITETKMIDNPQQFKEVQKWIKQPINYLDKQSLIPENSEAHYSFQEEKSSFNNESHEPLFNQKIKIPLESKSIVKEQNDFEVTDHDILGKKIMKETKISNNHRKNMAELSYSDSEEQDSNI